MHETKARIEFIDIIKALAIILVVIGHTSPNRTEILPYKSIIYAFHMPLFFILSGIFVATRRENYSLKTLQDSQILYICVSALGLILLISIL